MDDSPQRRLIPKPAWLERFEGRLGELVPVHHHVLSLLKLLVVAPLLLITLRQVGVLEGGPALVLLLFGLFAGLDYLDGLVARSRGSSATWTGRVLDRVTDYPVVFVVSLFCVELIPLPLLAAKLALDLCLLVLFVRGRGSTENRIRTVISHTFLLCLLALSQGWAPQLVTAELVEALLWLNIALSAIVGLRLAGLFRRKMIADALSSLNLFCGLLAIGFASRGRVDLSVLFVVLGALFDGCDGAAARRFGSTPWGVYSDDVADAVTYGLAPGAALILVVGGWQGWLVGCLYIVLTWGRLTYFTLSKSVADPDFFSGVPSTAGALAVLCALGLFPGRPLLVGLTVGIAGMQMVSFDTPYRHVGRAMMANPRLLWAGVAFLLALVLCAALWSGSAALATILGAVLAYGFGPTVLHFKRILTPPRAAVSA